MTKLSNNMKIGIMILLMAIIMVSAHMCLGRLL